MSNKIFAALSVLAVAVAFGVVAWAAEVKGNQADNAPVQEQKAGCDKCAKQNRAQIQPAAANCVKCGKPCKECTCSKDCKDCEKMKSGCNKMTKDGMPCPADCDKKADSAKI